MRSSRTFRHVLADIATLVALPLVCATADAAPVVCKAASGPQTTPLVELYTSEGCDSCPPADRWLSAQFPKGSAPSKPIALAFHVDYWDRLGWVDRFASPQWTERQYDAVRAHKDAFAYTPQLMLQGHDFAAWRRGNAQAALDDVSRRPARADLELAATVDGNAVRANVTARVADAGLAKALWIGIAYADSGLVSDVKAGENRGVRLTHDHVVRALAKGRAGALEASASFTRPAEAGDAPTLVAFIQSNASNDVLQAVALPLAACTP
jgi:hypothetical protein